MGALVEQALAYAAAGVPVLPVHTPLPGGGCSCGHAACPRPGKHPRTAHGLTGASTDADLVRSWWRRWPAANIGLRTGVVADVCDVDSPAGLRAVLRRTGPFAGPVVRTGSGGWHLYLAPTGLGNRVRLLPDVDWRGAGGYVVAPPSRHVSGRRYRWLRPLSAGPPPCPPALAALLSRPDPPATRLPPPRLADRYARSVLAAEAAEVASTPPGARNDRLNRAAFALGRYVAAGLLAERAVVAELTRAALAAGLGRAETARTIRSGLGAATRRPWPAAGG
jgi:hypothetical protein